MIIDNRHHLMNLYSNYVEATRAAPGDPIILARWRVRCCGRLRTLTWYGKLIQRGPWAGRVIGGRLSLEKHTEEERVALTLADAKCACQKALEFFRLGTQGVRDRSYAAAGLSGNGWTKIFERLSHRQRYDSHDPLGQWGLPPTRMGSAHDPERTGSIFSRSADVLWQKGRYLFPELPRFGRVPGWASAAKLVGAQVFTLVPTIPRKATLLPDGRAQVQTGEGRHSVSFIATLDPITNRWCEVPDTRKKVEAP